MSIAHAGDASAACCQYVVNLDDPDVAVILDRYLALLTFIYEELPCGKLFTDKRACRQSFIISVKCSRHCAAAANRWPGALHSLRRVALLRLRYISVFQTAHQASAIRDITVPILNNTLSILAQRSQILSSEVKPQLLPLPA